MGLQLALIAFGTPDVAQEVLNEHGRDRWETGIDKPRTYFVMIKVVSCYLQAAQPNQIRTLPTGLPFPHGVVPGMSGQTQISRRRARTALW